MPARFKQLIIVNLLVIFMLPAAVRAQKPEPVPRLTRRALDKASYVELAGQWQNYIDQHGPSAEALVNLGRAHDYSGAKQAALRAARQAVDLDPDSPPALSFLGGLLFKYSDDTDEAVRLLERCREIAPAYEYGLTNLATIYMRRGELDKSSVIFKAIFDQRLYNRPIQDFAYNLMIGLPEGAVLITNGDMDTFPPLALQAGKEFRTDVVILNRHLLNIDQYREAFFERYPAVRPGGRMEAEGELSLAHTLIKRMIEDEDITVYIAPTVARHQLGFSPETQLEGLNFNTGRSAMSAAQSARLLLERYRLDSATDWGFPWDLHPGTARLISNYVIAIVQLARQDETDPATRARLLAKARGIAEFHDDHRMIRIINSVDKK